MKYSVTATGGGTIANAPHNTNIVDMTGGTANVVVDLANRRLKTSNATMIDWGVAVLQDGLGTNGTVLNWDTCQLLVQSSHRLDWFNNLTYDSSGLTSIDWGSRQLFTAALPTLNWGASWLIDAASAPSVDWNNKHLISTGQTTVDWYGRALYDASSVGSLDWQSRLLYDASSVSIDWGARSLISPGAAIVVDWNALLLKDSFGASSYDWSNRIAYDTSGTTSAHFQNRTLYDASTQNSLDWSARILYAASSVASIDYNNRLLKDTNALNCIDYNNRALLDAGGTNSSFAWGTSNNLMYKIISFSGGGASFTPTAAVDIIGSTTSQAGLRIRTGAAPTSPNDGDHWLDTTQKALLINEAGINQVLQGVVFTATADATVANTLTEGSVLGTGIGIKTLPANFFAPGKTVRVNVRGKIGSILTPTLRLKVKLGSTIICDTNATALVAITGTNLWETEAIITCRTTGTTGTVYGQASVQYYSIASTANFVEAVNTATTTVNTAISQALDVTITWGTANASNTITGTNVLVEVLN